MHTATARKTDHVTSSNLPRPRIHGLRLAARGPTTDLALAQAAARGAMAAMADLYERHNRRVYSVCLGMTRNTAEAEDLTQEVFIHLLSKIGSFRGESQFGTWLHRLTVNLVLMHFRRTRPLAHQIAGDVEIRSNQPPPGEQLANRIALDSALAQLPSGCRSVFVLFDIVGYRHDEIANLLGCSVGTSKSQLHRARSKLKQLLISGLSKWN
jgi:RNA polymerase sigma-70 factor, ECF subfamily